MIQYKEIWEGHEAEIVEKKSRFIAHVKAVYSIEEAQEYIEQIKKEYWDARHNCFAYSIGVDNPITRFSDDGEPGGTAGKPILEVILGSEIHNIVIIVTRYFGGTLLGTGGLVRAYTQSARAGIDHSVIIDKIAGLRCLLSMEYTDLGKIQYVLAQNNVITESVDYGEKVSMLVLVEKTSLDRVDKKITEATSARVKLKKQDELYYASIDGEVITFEQ